MYRIDNNKESEEIALFDVRYAFFWAITSLLK